MWKQLCSSRPSYLIRRVSPSCSTSFGEKAAFLKPAVYCIWKQRKKLPQSLRICFMLKKNLSIYSSQLRWGVVPVGSGSTTQIPCQLLIEAEVRIRVLSSEGAELHLLCLSWKIYRKWNWEPPIHDSLPSLPATWFPLHTESYQWREAHKLLHR